MPLLRACPEIEETHIEAVLKTPGRGEDSTLDEKHSVVMAYADAMTLDVKVSDEVFARLKRSFSDREVVEITATISAYNCVSRFLVALDVGERNKQDGPIVR